MPRLKLTIAYVGTRFSGWQLQDYKMKKQPRTVQGELEKAVHRLLGSHAGEAPVRVFGAGRTDAGVHAEGQVAHLDIPEGVRLEDWPRGFSALLPHDMAVTSIAVVPPDFHARMDATGKRYSYELWLDRSHLPPRLREFTWQTGPLDIAAMQQAVLPLIGQHDFASFQNSGSEVKTTIRTISAIHCEETGPSRLLWHFEADGFLKQMVRNLMGLLVQVGQGKLDAARVPDFLEARNRQALPSPTAPAQGLTLMKVFY
ncbi:tRNA pseudouridine(38-40) synthase TruA [Desulfovibrio sp. OttesenSCG-928-I05]|nr:tRNA pseudouridine(38-40) synthase TruA [Desulfovibrio sp. OttesenSCG-928-I05]